MSANIDHASFSISAAMDQEKVDQKDPCRKSQLIELDISKRNVYPCFQKENSPKRYTKLQLFVAPMRAHKVETLFLETKFKFCSMPRSCMLIEIQRSADKVSGIEDRH